MQLKKQSDHYSSCKDLPLKVFFEVAETGNVQLLVINDAKIDNDILIDAWELILIEYGKLDNNTTIEDVFSKNQKIAILAARFIEVNAMLIYLKEVEYNVEYVERLNTLGYKVKGENYITDIEANEQRVNNIVTKIKFLQNDIKKYKTESKQSSFDHALAWISSNLNFWPPDNITVARYLELKKQINERNKSKRYN